MDFDKIVLLKDDLGTWKMKYILVLIEIVLLYVINPLSQPDIIEDKEEKEHGRCKKIKRWDPIQAAKFGI